MNEVVIPLSHIDPNSKYGLWVPQWRSYASQELVEALIEVAGPGCRGLWWTAAEALNCLHRSNEYSWAWCPTGNIDLLLPNDNQTNQQTHMRIFFKDPDHALLFKLTWNP